MHRYVFTLDSINILFISAFNARLISLLCLYLISTYSYVVQTIKDVDNLLFLQRMKYVDVDRAEIVVMIFFKLNCKDTYISHDIKYEVNYESLISFFSFSLSCVLKNNKQLNISCTNQNFSQSLNWICDNYLRSWLAETIKDCHNNHDLFEVVNLTICFRLLLY